MKEVPESDRGCRFRCVLALVGEGVEETFSGACEGTLLRERRGTGGFGYDPLFLPDESESTFAEISLEEKAKISHRARALAKKENLPGAQFFTLDVEKEDYVTILSDGPPDLVTAHLCMGLEIVRRAASVLPPGGMFACVALHKDLWREKICR